MSEIGTAPRHRVHERRLLLPIVGIAAVVFLWLPIVIVVPMSFSSAQSLMFPPPGFSLRWYKSFFFDPHWIQAALNSFAIAATASTVSLILGTLAAYGLVRGSLKWRNMLEANFMAPLALPAIITAVALYIFFARLGVLGSFWGLIIAHIVLITPYVVLLMSLAVAAFDHRIELVARTLGASKFEMLLRILLPNVLPNATSAWLLAFVVSFDEVVVTLFVSGTHITIPKRMFNELVMQINPTITAIATLLIVLSLLAVALVAKLTRGRHLIPAQAPARTDARPKPMQ